MRFVSAFSATAPADAFRCVFCRRARMAWCPAILLPPAISIDFKGWKTLILPLSTFTYQSDTDPASDRDGLSSATALTSANGIQFSFTASGSRVFLDDLGWTT